MSTSEEYQPFVGGSQKEEPQPAPIYHDKSSTPAMVSFLHKFIIVSPDFDTAAVMIYMTFQLACIVKTSNKLAFCEHYC